MSQFSDASALLCFTLCVSLGVSDLVHKSASLEPFFPCLDSGGLNGISHMDSIGLDPTCLEQPTRGGPRNARPRHSNTCKGRRPVLVRVVDVRSAQSGVVEEALRNLSKWRLETLFDVLF